MVCEGQVVFMVVHSPIGVLHRGNIHRTKGPKQPMNASCHARARLKFKHNRRVVFWLLFSSPAPLLSSSLSSSAIHTHITNQRQYPLLSCFCRSPIKTAVVSPQNGCTRACVAVGHPQPTEG